MCACSESTHCDLNIFKCFRVQTACFDSHSNSYYIYT